MTRNNSIDNIRLLAIFGIIVMHCFPFFYTEFSGAKTLAISINQLTRFGVPCFFTISGYLYAQRITTAGAGSLLKKTSMRLLMLYFFWCVFYVLPYNLALITEKAPRGNVDMAIFQLFSWTANAENFLLGGSKAHLWFLPALLCATVICTPFIVYRRIGAMLLLTAFIFVIALLGGPYHDKFPGITLPIQVRNGPLFSSVFFAAGAALAMVRKQDFFFRTGLVLTLAGAAGQLFEVFQLVRDGYNPSIPLYPDFVVSTLPFGIGVAMIGISGAAAHNNTPWLWGIGRYTLGIYALHFFVMDFFMPINSSLRTSIAWQAGSPLLYFVLTTALVLCLARVRWLRPLIA